MSSISKFLSILVTLACYNFSYGTSFLPTSIENQVKSSSGVVWGTFRSQTYKRLPNGLVVTEASFEIKKVAGVERNKIFNDKDFKVLIPGGDWEGTRTIIDSAPTFQPGEEAVILLSEHNKSFYVHNLAMGKYVPVLKNGRKILRSALYPEGAKYSSIDLEEFESLVEDNFKEKLKPIESEKIIVKKKEENKFERKRSIASIDDEVEEVVAEEESNKSFYMFLFAFFCFGVILLRKISWNE